MRLFPLYHPAAALYTRSLLDVLRADFQRIPDLLAQPVPDQPEPEPDAEPQLVVPEPVLVPDVAGDEPDEPDANQLGLF